MSISTYIAPITKGVELVTQLLIEEYQVNPETAKKLAENRVKPHLAKLKDTCYLLAETSYVDKVYRDSYYHYYSSKLNNYKRDCIRLSIFEGEIKDGDFRQPERVKELHNIYRGFIVLRPIQPFVIGRSVISPKALKENTFLSCWTNFHTTVNGIKFEVEGFPHSSQDTETLSCAETTLWAIMEYFGNKYPEYNPVLPSKIITALNKVTTERQLPSKGLNIQQMSFALREFGFGTRVYGRDEYAEDFEKLISTYVESGVPVTLAVDNMHKGGNIGHAILCVGHEQINDGQIDALLENQILNPTLKSAVAAKGIKLYDLDGIKKEFIFIDDNCPIYQKAGLDSPAKHDYYPAAWHTCQVRHFIVPLYHKIYLEAFEAKNFIFNFIVTGPEPIQPGSEVLIKTFLASSRSFKDFLALNNTFQDDVRELILETPMPKFIWIAEISDKNLMKKKMANGIVILDATEANIYFNKPLILAAYQDKLIKPDSTDGKLENIALTLQPFSIYTRNLRNL